MQDYNFKTETLRFHLTKKDTVILRGWYPENNPENRHVEIQLDGENLSFKEEKKSGVEIRQKYLAYMANVNEELVYEIVLPADWRTKKNLQIKCRGTQECKTVQSYPVKKLIKMAQSVEYYIETENVSDGKVTLSGWAMSNENINFVVYDAFGKKTESSIERYYRKDVAAVFEEAESRYEAGFKLVFQKGKGGSFKLVMAGGEKQSVYKNTYSAMKAGKKKQGASLFQKVKFYYKRNGFKATLFRAKTKLLRQPDNNYNQWRKRYLITAEELEAQRKTVFENAPKFSIVIPLYKTPEKYLCEMLDSIIDQTYTNWELCLSDGSGKEGTLKPLLENYRNRDARIRFCVSEESLKIADNTNVALAMTTGDYIVFADHDDIMPPEALYECAKAIVADESIDMIYSDEDKVDMAGKTYFEPNFKPDINIDLLRSMNYICHLCVVKKELLHKAGMLRGEFDGAQDYDFILRCVEKAEHIHHIPKVLYHWRCHLDSTASNPESKVYAFEAGKRALEEHYRRVGIPAKVEHSNYYGMYHTVYEWEEKPLISVLIPNKDHIADLKKCIDSLVEKSTYRNFEIVIIENNSVEEETFAYYGELTGKTYAPDKAQEGMYRDVTVRVVTWKDAFNYSAINNFGAKHAKGEYFLLLNNDTELISPDTLQEMLNYCMREDVGIVGAKLNYEDDTIQHAGVVIGFGGIAGHTFIGSSRYDLGYQGRIVCAQDYSAVTAACLLTDRASFKAVGGLTEELQVAFNDIDYCMKVRALGKLVVYNPYAELYHYESKSRGLEDTPEKVARFNREIAAFQERWPDILKSGDPYFNPNLSLDKADFSLK
ncbi:MAG: glycosyltransferase family 2 protein [Lachnospiraceae bacterium]|nr:glycosyltransferase family 2 protein [Lachnospiraceae bacterium]